MGLATTCARLGIVVPLPKGSGGGAPPPASEGGVHLGLTQRGYNFTGECGVVELFQAACAKQSTQWHEARACKELREVVQRLHSIVAGVSEECPAMLGTKANSYVRLFLVRMLLLGCLAHEALPVDWNEVPVSLLPKMGPDENGHLSCFDDTWSIGDVSRFMFDRDDWGIFVGMFACLWGDVAQHWPEDKSRILDMVVSGTFGEEGRRLAARMGHALCPLHIVRTLMSK